MPDSTDVNTHDRSYAIALGSRIRAIRGRRKQEEIVESIKARGISTSLSSLRKYEQGERVPDAEWVKVFCESQNADVLDLIGLKPPLRQPELAYQQREAEPVRTNSKSHAELMLDMEMLTACIEALEEARPALDPMKKAEAIAALYELVRLSPRAPHKATLLQFIRSAA